MIVCKELGITLRAKGPNPEISSLSVRCSIGGMPAVNADDCVCGYFRQMHFAKLRLGKRRNAFSLRTYKSGCCITFLITYRRAEYWPRCASFE